METVAEIDENERYWVGGGFGSRGLLPTDRGPYTTTDGSMSWKTPAECGDDLVFLGRGWRYEEGSAFTPATNWMYAIDFRLESIKNAKPDRGMMHWVRFRRLYRTKIFNPDDFVPSGVSEKCSHVDSSATSSLSNLMLDALAYCTLLHSPSTLTDAVALPLKTRIINIAISQQQQQQPQTPSSTPAEANNEDAFYQLDQLRKRVEKFVEEERARTIMNRLLKSVEFSFDQRGTGKDFKERQSGVGKRCFPVDEREAIASLIVKGLDRHYQLHCGQPDCGSKCRFLRVECPNDGCSDVMSQMYLDQHHCSCPHMLITCECGDTFPRLQLAVHKTQACKMRDVECPFRKLGCMIDVKACDLQQHIEEDSPSHLLLAVNRMSEHEDVIKTLHAKVASLERENQGLKQTFEAHEKVSMKLVSGLEARITKTSKELAALGATCTKEFRKRASLRTVE